LRTSVFDPEHSVSAVSPLRRRGLAKPHLKYCGLATGLTQTGEVDNRRPEHDAIDQMTGFQSPDRTRSFSKVQMTRFPNNQ
jgi:hypothetical protein